MILIGVWPLSYRFKLGKLIFTGALLSGGLLFTGVLALWNSRRRLVGSLGNGRLHRGLAELNYIRAGIISGIYIYSGFEVVGQDAGIKMFQPESNCLNRNQNQLK